MTCNECTHAVMEAVKTGEIEWTACLLCCQGKTVRVVDPRDTCKHFEREPGTEPIDVLGRGDSVNG